MTGRGMGHRHAVIVFISLYYLQNILVLAPERIKNGSTITITKKAQCTSKRKYNISFLLNMVGKLQQCHFCCNSPRGWNKIWFRNEKNSTYQDSCARFLPCGFWLGQFYPYHVGNRKPWHRLVYLEYSSLSTKWYIISNWYHTVSLTINYRNPNNIFFFHFFILCLFCKWLYGQRSFGYHSMVVHWGQVSITVKPLI